MYTISVNGSESIQADLDLQNGQFTGTLEGAEVRGDFIRVSEHQYHLLYNNRSYNVELLKMDAVEKSVTLRLNSVKYTVRLKDKYDELLHKLGMDVSASRKVNDIKAPMPGMVLNILVQEGAEVKKGDVLLVLEAMKMENVIKSPCDGTVKLVAAKKGSAVEKNQLLIQF